MRTIRACVAHAHHSSVRTERTVRQERSGRERRLGRSRAWSPGHVRISRRMVLAQQSRLSSSCRIGMDDTSLGRAVESADGPLDRGVGAGPFLRVDGVVDRVKRSADGAASIGSDWLVTHLPLLALAQVFDGSSLVGHDNPSFTIRLIVSADPPMSRSLLTHCCRWPGRDSLPPAAASTTRAEARIEGNHWAFTGHSLGIHSDIALDPCTIRRSLRQCVNEPERAVLFG